MDDGRWLAFGVVAAIAAAGLVRSTRKPRRGSRDGAYEWRASGTMIFDFDKYTSEDTEEELEFTTDSPDEGEAEAEAARILRDRDYEELAEYLVPPLPEPKVIIHSIELIRRPRVSFRNPE
jgi:hypothetical protein